jgi:DNA-binding NarL/FixJ family response regulator
MVLLDLTMPGMDTAEIVRELRRIRPDVRIILSSGFDATEISERFARQQLTGFLQKPYTAAALVSRISEACLRASPVAAADDEVR